MKTRMGFKKETKRAVVYKTSDPKAPTSTLYVNKAWFAERPEKDPEPSPYPRSIMIEVSVATSGLAEKEVM